MPDSNTPEPRLGDPHQDQLDHLDTEAVPAADNHLDTMSVAELVRLMNQRDATLADTVANAAPTITAAIEDTAARMAAGGRLIYIGAGTSGRLGVLDASEIPPTFGTPGDVVVGVVAGGPQALVSSIEDAEDRPDDGASAITELGVGANDTVVGIASSGRTPYVLGAMARATELGALTVGLSCNTGTPLSAVTDHAIEVPVGPEIVSGSTRLGAGTVTKMVLNMFSTITMVRLGKTYGSLMVDVQATNDKLRRRAVRILTQVTGCDDSEARTTLEAAGWQTKLAVTMLATGTDASAAAQALADAGGILRDVIDRDA